MITKEKQKALLNHASENYWWGVYDIISDGDDLLDFSALVDHPELEAALMYVVSNAENELIHLLISRDREVVTRYPDLKDIKAAKKVPDHYAEAWRYSAALRTLRGIHKRLVEQLETDPHRDISGLLMRACRFPPNYKEFKVVMRSAIEKVLELSSLLGLELTLFSLQDYDQKIFRETIAILIWETEYHDKIDYLYDRNVFGHDVLKQIIPIARKRGFPKESLEWIDERLSKPEPYDPDVPF